MTLFHQHLSISENTHTHEGVFFLPVNDCDAQTCSSRWGSCPPPTRTPRWLQRTGLKLCTSGPLHGPGRPPPGEAPMRRSPPSGRSLSPGSSDVDNARWTSLLSASGARQADGNVYERASGSGVFKVKARRGETFRTLVNSVNYPLYFLIIFFSIITMKLWGQKGRK